MFDRVTIRVADLEASTHFYETVLVTIGGGNGDWALEPAAAGAQPTERLHVGFFAPLRAAVDAFWRAGVESGFRNDGEPGPRPQYGDDYYGGFLLDPDGNSAEAVHHDEHRIPGQVDHLWMRVGDLEAARARHGAAAERGGFRLAHDGTDRLGFKDGECEFSLLVGKPTRRVRIALAGGAELVF